MSSSPASGASGAVAVVGAGAIGLSWASLFVAHDYQVWVTDPRPDLAAALGAALAEAAPVLADLGLPSQGLERHLHVAGNLAEAVAAADFVQENGPERVDVKRSLFTDIQAAAPPHCIVVSSSSAIPVTSAEGVVGADRIVIGHPFNPPLVMPLVEVVPGKQTSTATTKAATDFYLSVGKQPIVVGKELPGFVANRLQNALVRIQPRSRRCRHPHRARCRRDQLGGPAVGCRRTVPGAAPGRRAGWLHTQCRSHRTGDGPDVGDNPDPDTFRHVGELVDATYSDSPIPEQAALRDERQVAILQSLARIDEQR